MKGPKTKKGAIKYFCPDLLLSFRFAGENANAISRSFSLLFKCQKHYVNWELFKKETNPPELHKHILRENSERKSQWHYNYLMWERRFSKGFRTYRKPNKFSFKSILCLYWENLPVRSGKRKIEITTCKCQTTGKVSECPRTKRVINVCFYIWRRENCL